MSEIENSFRLLFENKLSQSEAREFLIELYNRSESADDITAGAKVMREFSTKLKVDDSIADKLIDNCGTGGDKSGSFNISTTVSILLASMGCFVAKHGNRSITSKSGSADVLEALGVNLDLDIERESKLLNESGFTFMFAINHHPAMKYVMPIRKSIEHRTIFNLLGPLTNPAGAKKQLIGVFSKEFVPKVAKSLHNLDSKSAIIVSSNDGLDEASISDITHCSQLKEGKVSDFELNPVNYGLKLASLEAIKGADAKANAQIMLDLLNGESGAKRDIVLLNASLAFVVDGVARDIKDGLEMAREAIDSKKAIEKLKEIIEVSNKI